ncbi:MAG: VWD domain-containing protein, partial [Marinicaulis sp.]|nr:VWD domain-containing protein [Marinicaulis sp.]
MHVKFSSLSASAAIVSIAIVVLGEVRAQGCNFSPGGSSGPATYASRDIAARNALNDAWAAHIDHSMASDGNEFHEFGGWIYETSDGEYGYTTPARGTEDFVSVSDLPAIRDSGDGEHIELSNTGERIAGFYHIHPGDLRNEDGELWDNARFSGDDINLAETGGFPNYMRHGDRYRVYDPAVNNPDDPPSAWGNVPPPESAPPRRSTGGCSVGYVGGEPHFRTHDGRHFKFQGAGEFIAVSDPSDGLTIQLRLEPWLDFKTVSVVSALAMSTGNDRIGIYVAEPHIRINGKAMTAAAHTLTDGTEISRDENAVRIRTAAGDGLIVTNLGRSWLDAAVRLIADRHSTPRGLWGDFDGDRENDFVARNGAIVDFAHADKEQFRTLLYDVWGDSWRISHDESLFDYDEGKTSEEYQLRDFPAKILPERNALTHPAASAALQKCRNSGVTDVNLLANCVYDVIVTGDDEFSISYATFQNELSTLASLDLYALPTNSDTGPKGPEGLGSGMIIGGFSNAVETLHLLGGATTVDRAALQLTAAAENQIGAVFIPQKMKLSGGITVSFDFRIDQTGGAMDLNGASGGDGLAYVLSPSLPEELMGPGAGLGYAGLNDAVIIEFDTFRDAHDASSMHISVNRQTRDGRIYADNVSSIVST